MGVDRTDYLMLAVDLGADIIDDDLFEQLENELDITDASEFHVIVDSMCGKYCYAGWVLDLADQYEGFSKVVLEDLPTHLLDREKLAIAINAKLGTDIKPADFKTLLFSHFS